MQTITGIARVCGNNSPLSLGTLHIQERRGQNYAGNTLFDVATDVDGNFSFQVRPGQYFLRFDNDAIPFRVTESSGTTTIGQLVEAA